ncbi:MAG: DUF6146 family protein [Marinirhabdus sp.]
MKYTIPVFILILALAGCNTGKRTMQGNDPIMEINDTLRIANDSLEYEIIIIEPGFNAWLVTQFPEAYYSLSFLENQNAFYVGEYNRRVINAAHDNELYPLQINYELGTRYGKEVNYLLYNYFVYFEKTYNQKLK